MGVEIIDRKHQKTMIESEFFDMNRKGSIMKRPSRAVDCLANNLKKQSSILVPDGLDGWNALPFAFKGHRVTIFELEDVFVHGGVVISNDIKYHIHGLNKRIEGYGLKNLVDCFQLNFYENLPRKTFDLVYANRTLHRECNSHLTIKEKIDVLKSVVSVGGEIYLQYYLATYDNDIINFPINQYPRTGEVIKYFDNEQWEILLIKERNKLNTEKPHFGNPFVHYHKVGYIHARKKNIYEKSKYYKMNYNICLGTKLNT